MKEGKTMSNWKMNMYFSDYVQEDVYQLYYKAADGEKRYSRFSFSYPVAATLIDLLDNSEIMADVATYNKMDAAAIFSSSEARKIRGKITTAFDAKRKAYRKDGDPMDSINCIAWLSELSKVAE